jgi:pimeloyl-ACP methyl ester carboxylesterase
VLPTRILRRAGRVAPAIAAAVAVLVASAPASGAGVAAGSRLRAPVPAGAARAQTRAGILTATSLSASAAPRVPLHVGRLTLTPCAVVAGAYCGSITRPWDPTGAVPGTLSVGFAFRPATDAAEPALGTLVPHEGGPGYSTTDSGIDYANMYGPLLQRRNLLLVDQRGTGLTAPVSCWELQNANGVYARQASTCAAKLGDHANLYGTALSADDLAAVVAALGVGQVDLYGDSYGTFFAQVFAGRHPAMLRSIVLDSAYPPTGETAWYPTQTPAMVGSIDLVCARTPSCAAAGQPPSQLLARVLAQVRRSPYRGVSYNADGIRVHVTVDGAALVTVAFGATFGPAWYRELPGALRSALAGDRAPLLRLVAEADYVEPGGGPVAAYSEGLDAAVTCHDYPQLYDMTASPARRRAELAASVAAEDRSDPTVYAPFTVEEYLQATAWEELDWCLDWPVAPVGNPAGPPAPPSGHYPAVPTLVLSGELDSITTPAEGSMVAAQFPGARHVYIANSFHVTAEDDTDGCAVQVLRAFVADPATGLTPGVLACTAAVPPVRAVSAYVPSFHGIAPARAGPGSHVAGLGLQATAAAALSVADVLDRWFSNESGAGVGLYGGAYRYTGNAVITFRLTGFQLERDLAVSGTVTWGRYTHQLTAHLTVQQLGPAGTPVAGSAVDGTIDASWDTRAAAATATLTGLLGGQRLVATMLAP